jgi:hypothetical protein
MGGVFASGAGVLLSVLLVADSSRNLEAAAVAAAAFRRLDPDSAVGWLKVVLTYASLCSEIYFFSAPSALRRYGWERPDFADSVAFLYSGIFDPPLFEIFRGLQYRVSIVAYALLLGLVLCTRVVTMPRWAISAIATAQVPAYDILAMPALALMMRGMTCTEKGILRFDGTTACDGGWEHGLQLGVVVASVVVFQIGPSAVFLMLVQPYQSVARPVVYFIPTYRGLQLFCKFAVTLALLGSQAYSVPAVGAAVTLLCTLSMAAFQLLRQPCLAEARVMNLARSAALAASTWCALCALAQVTKPLP